jgi:proton-dependent oligopeptide transporter, POT family
VVAVLATLGGIGFWFQMRDLDKEEDHLNMLPKGHFASEASDDEAVRATTETVAPKSN